MSQGSNDRGPLDAFLTPKFKPHRAPSIRYPPPTSALERLLGQRSTEPEMELRGPLSTPLFLFRLLRVLTANPGRLANEIPRF